jgi:hypothetical protein
MNNASRVVPRPDDDSPTTALSLLLFVSAALALFFTALFGGGQPWAILTLLVLVVQSLADRRLVELAMIVPALGWLVLFRLTGNRELFFPFAMYLAAHVSLLLGHRSPWLGACGGIVTVASFLVLRYQQQATWPVLAVELGVAAGILGLTLLAHTMGPKNRWADTVITGAASLLAYWGLSI